jgi:hypothetical protein
LKLGVNLIFMRFVSLAIDTCTHTRPGEPSPARRIGVFEY